MTDSELVFKSGTELAALIGKRQVSPVEVVRAYLSRIEKLNPQVNAFITVTGEQALQRAREQEKEIVAGKYRGPLHGLPYAPKDILATAGIRTTNGSKVDPDWIPAYESTVTERLNRAGAIMMGKLNLLEYAMRSGVLSGFGPARNPWNLAYSPSGSSSGSGAAVAAYMTPLCIGTDTGGSIRGPAANCGIVGLKQTYGRVSRFGVTTLSWTLDHVGPMTKTVADAAMLLQVIAGPDPKDSTASQQPVPNYSESLNKNVKGLRIGVPTNYFYDNGNPETIKAIHTAIAKLSEMGATVVDVNVPHANLAGPALWIIAMAEGACFHETRLREKADLFDPLVRERLEAAKFYPATEYIKALRVRTLLMEDMRQVFEKCDVMVVPGGHPAGKLDPPEVAKSDVRSGPSSLTPLLGLTAIGNMVGMPGLVMPCGFTSHDPVLPLALQFYAKPFDEASLFRVGNAYESATEWHKRRPSLAA